MKNLIKPVLVLSGFIIALAAATPAAHAKTLLQPVEHTGSCVQTGDCGTTAGGVKLNGFWRESVN
jgi:hypothetical protein